MVGEIRQMDGQRGFETPLRSRLCTGAPDGLCIWIPQLRPKRQPDGCPGHIRHHVPHCAGICARPTLRHRPDPLSGLPEFDLPRQTDATEWYHTIRQEHLLSQARRILSRLLHMGAHCRPLEQFCPTSYQGRVRLQGLASHQFHHWTWVVRLCHVVCAHGYVCHLAREAATRQLRALLVCPPPLHHLLCLLEHTWRLLHDQARRSTLLLWHWRLLEVLDVWRIRIPDRAHFTRDPRTP